MEWIYILADGEKNGIQGKQTDVWIPNNFICILFFTETNQNQN